METCVAFPRLVPLMVYGMVTVFPLLVTGPFNAIVISLSKSVSLYCAFVSPAVPKMSRQYFTVFALIFQEDIAKPESFYVKSERSSLCNSQHKPPTLSSIYMQKNTNCQFEQIF